MTESKLAFTPVVIIGSGRSGTNALRDMLTRLPEFETWKCDEINPIWRHGNLSWPNDEIPAERATPRVRNFIRGAFVKLWSASHCPRFVVEKTCANSLRVPFIDTVLPEARYIHIVRNGFDVVASARKRWKGDLELPGFSYFSAKIRYTPLRDLPIYGWSFLKSRFALAFGGDRRLGVWGPRFAGMETMGPLTLEVLCAHQWAACVEQADAGFSQIDAKRVLLLRYEDFTHDPHKTLVDILAFLGTTANEIDINEAVGPVRATSVGKGQSLRDALPPEVHNIMADALGNHGYGI